jgi:lipase chaperone LimK
LLAALTELRRDWLGVAAAEAFFGDEEAYARATLAREAVLGDPTLAAGQREERLAAIDATLDPRLVESRERALAHLDVVAENRVFDALEVDAPIRLEQRTVQYGADAADRLATLDAERADWSARSERYFAERERIQASTRLTGAEADAAIAALEAAFTESERRRLAALGRIRASGH